MMIIGVTAWQDTVGRAGLGVRVRAEGYKIHTESWGDTESEHSLAGQPGGHKVTSSNSDGLLAGSVQRSTKHLTL